MFRITEDPSSGSLVQCFAKITRMVLSCPLTWTRSVLWQHTDQVQLFSYSKKKALKMTDVCAENRLHRTQCTSG